MLETGDSYLCALGRKIIPVFFEQETDTCVLLTGQQLLVCLRQDLNRRELPLRFGQKLSCVLDSSPISMHSLPQKAVGSQGRNLQAGGAFLS